MSNMTNKLIASPILALRTKYAVYDAVFKHLMENYFIETLIGEKVTEIAVAPLQPDLSRRRKETRNSKLKNF